MGSDLQEDNTFVRRCPRCYKTDLVQLCAVISKEQLYLPSDCGGTWTMDSHSCFPQSWKSSSSELVIVLPGELSTVLSQKGPMEESNIWWQGNHSKMCNMTTVDPATCSIRMQKTFKKRNEQCFNSLYFINTSETSDPTVESSHPHLFPVTALKQLLAICK